MTKREHFERWLKTKAYRLPLDYTKTADGGYYHNDMVDIAYQAWLASPKTRPTENGRATKERLAELKADTSGIVDNLRGIYAGAADAYAVTPLTLKAADEIERLRLLAGEFAGEDRDELVRRTIHRLAEYLKTTNKPEDL
jgi:hypothetical protein